MITRDDLQPGNRVLIEAEIVELLDTSTEDKVFDAGTGGRRGVIVRVTGMRSFSLVPFVSIKSVEKQDFAADI